MVTRILLGTLGAGRPVPALMQKDYPFDPLRDYVPIATIAEWSALFVVNKNVPVNNLKEFIAYAKERPGKINFGATGYGGCSPGQRIFMQNTGIRMQHVWTSRGSLVATTDVPSGSIDAHMMSLVARCRRPDQQSPSPEIPGGRKQAPPRRRARTC